MCALGLGMRVIYVYVCTHTCNAMQHEQHKGTYKQLKWNLWVLHDTSSDNCMREQNSYTLPHGYKGSVSMDCVVGGDSDLLQWMNVQHIIKLDDASAEPPSAYTIP